MLKFLIISNIWLAGFFGLQLHFFSTTGIDDPVINPLYTIAKDLYMVITVFFGACSFVFKRKKTIKTIHILHFILFIIIIFLILLRIEFLTMTEIKFIKSIILYGILFPFIVGTHDEISFSDLKKALIVSLVLATIASLAIYIYRPYASHTGRNFGTFGNPNALGVFSVVSLVLFSEIKNKINKFLLILVATINIFSTMSVLVFGLLSLYLVWCIRKNKALIFTLFIILTLPVLYFDSIIHHPIVSQWINRPLALLASGMEHESFFIRYHDYEIAINSIFDINISEFYLMDTALSTLLFNYGILGLLMVFCWFFFGVVRPVVLNGFNIFKSSIYFSLLLLFISALIQFTIVMYPGIVYFSVLIVIVSQRMANRLNDYSFIYNKWVSESHIPAKVT